MTNGEIISLVGLVPGFGGLVLAIWGVSKWRRELVGKAHFDLARQALTAVYGVRGAIGDVRHEASGADLESKRSHLRPKLSELDVVVVQTEVLWGSVEFKVAVQPLRDLAHKLMANLIRQYKSEKDQGYREGLARRGKLEEVDAIIWGDSDDEFGQAVAKAVEAAEQVLRRHLPRSLQAVSGSNPRSKSPSEPS